MLLRLTSPASARQLLGFSSACGHAIRRPEHGASAYENAHGRHSIETILQGTYDYSLFFGRATLRESDLFSLPAVFPSRLTTPGAIEVPRSLPGVSNSSPNLASCRVAELGCSIGDDPPPWFRHGSSSSRASTSFRPQERKWRWCSRTEAVRFGFEQDQRG